jgi:hypothetical protein
MKRRHEKDLPAKQYEEEEETRISGSHAKQKWKGNPSEEEEQGKEALSRLIKGWEGGS